MISIGVLGCGRIGQVHAQTVAKSGRAKLVAVADAMPEAAENVAAQYGAAVRSVDEIIQSTDIDAVIICTPTPTHSDLIEAAASAGKAVMCEKPVDLSAKRIEQCLDAIEGKNAPLLIGFNRRFDPNFADLQARIARGDIGDVEIVTITSRDPSPPPLSYIGVSGGIFRDMMIHDLDLARFLLGEEAIEVHAVGAALVDPAIGEAGDVDTAAVMLKTASGKICQISCSRRASYGYDQRIEVHGAKGMLRAGNIHQTSVEIATNEGFLSDPVMDFFLERYALAYELELTHFLDCIENGTSPSPNGYDGLRAQMLADAATEAHQTGKAISLS